MPPKFQTAEGVPTHVYTVLDEFDADGFPDTAVDVIKLLTARLGKLPIGVAREGLLVEITNGRYDGDRPEVTLSCWEPRPPAVVEAEVKRVRSRLAYQAQNVEAAERRQLQALLDKYGVPK